VVYLITVVKKPCPIQMQPSTRNEKKWNTMEDKDELVMCTLRILKVPVGSI